MKRKLSAKTGSSWRKVPGPVAEIALQVHTRKIAHFCVVLLLLVIVLIACPHDPSWDDMVKPDNGLIVYVQQAEQGGDPAATIRLQADHAMVEISPSYSPAFGRGFPNAQAALSAEWPLLRPPEGRAPPLS